MVARTRREMRGSALDARLRAESPAYAEDDTWEALAPQSMSVVVSVRLDPVSARQLTQKARQLNQAPSALVRQWTLQHLEEGRPTAHAIGEAAPSYGESYNEVEALRERYRPGIIRLLMVGESRPAGGTFFYRADSHLFYATREAWVLAHGSAGYGTRFLEQLKDSGVWLYDLAAAPVNRMSGRPRRKEVESRTAEFVDLLRAANPLQVIAIKRSLEPAARAAMASAGLDLERLVVVPFPLYQWRAEYLEQMSEVFGTVGDAGLQHPAPRARRADAAAAPKGDDRLDARAVTQPVTPNDLSSGQIRIPQHSKQLFPTGKGSVTAVLRGERLETTFDPRNGPDRPRSGVLRIPRAVLRTKVQPHDRLHLRLDGSVVMLD